MQTRRQSLIEAIVNIISGMVISFSISFLFTILSPYIALYLYSGFSFHTSIAGNIIVTITLTVVSIIRSYFWRRYFNKKHHTS
jgi:hypothetical protein